MLAIAAAVLGTLAGSSEGKGSNTTSPSVQSTSTIGTELTNGSQLTQLGLGEWTDITAGSIIGAGAQSIYSAMVQGRVCIIYFYSTEAGAQLAYQTDFYRYTSELVIYGPNYLLTDLSGVCVTAVRRTFGNEVGGH